MNKVVIPEHVKLILDKLKECGYEGYVVGGCVRDSLRGVTPKDWDITTNATPDEMKEVFKEYKLLPIGERYGTMTVLLNEESYEVTTFRADGEYSDGRRPDAVKFAENIEDDLSRRDFTVNAMAYSETAGLIDPYGGYVDLKARIIRCVGNAEDRFNEDALRIMRAVRFAVTMDFDISKDTVHAVWECGHNLCNVSAERKTAELVKILTSVNKLNRQSEHYQKLCRMVEYLIKRIIPEFQDLAQVTHNNPYHYTDIFTHTMEMLFADSADIEIQLTILFHDIGKIKARVFDEKRLTNHYYKHPVYSAEMTKEILTRMRFDSRAIDSVVKLIEVHDVILKPDRRCAKRLLNKLGHEQCLQLARFQELDKQAHRWNTSAEYEDWRQGVKSLREMWTDIVQNQEAFKVSDLAINGDDLIALGYGQGRAIGRMLNKCLDYVIEYPNKNTKPELLKYVKSKMFLL